MIYTKRPFQGHMYKPKTSNFTFLNVKPDVFGYLQIFCGEIGLRTFSPQVPYLQGYNNVNFTLSNVLVTEVCLIQSHIVFMMSVHLNITIQR